MRGKTQQFSLHSFPIYNKYSSLMWHLNLATQYYGNMNEAQQGIFEGAAGTLTLEFSSQVGLQLANYRKKP